MIMHTTVSGASLSAGFFVLYKAQGNSLVPIGEKLASERTARCTLRDFIVMDSNGVSYILLFLRNVRLIFGYSRVRRSIVYGNEVAKVYMK